MTDLEIAIENLEGHSICLCKDGKFFTDDKKGIAPMMEFISAGRDLAGFSAADVIVGRAAAMLFVKTGITAVYGKVMSCGAKEYLESHSIPCSFGELTERIINRQGTDTCPMEKTVADIDDPDEGYVALERKLKLLKAERLMNQSTLCSPDHD